MKKVVCILIVFMFILSLSACQTSDTRTVELLSPTNDSALESTPIPTPEVQAWVIPKKFETKEAFTDFVISEHKVFNETGKLSEYGLANVKYYLDFSMYPKDMVFKEITVPEDANYISIDYTLEDKYISLQWQRTKYGENYDHIEENKVFYEGNPQRLIVYDTQSILEVEHSTANGSLFDHYTYHWEQNNDYINLVIHKELVDQYGSETFLSVAKYNIEFGDVTPAVVVTPTPVVATPTPAQEINPGPTMAAPILP